MGGAECMCLPCMPVARWFGSPVQFAAAHKMPVVVCSFTKEGCALVAPAAGHSAVQRMGSLHYGIERS